MSMLRRVGIIGITVSKIEVQWSQSPCEELNFNIEWWHEDRSGGRVGGHFHENYTHPVVQCAGPAH